MTTKQSDNVFLLTLVDFLVQIIFFGLLVFVFYKSTEGRSKQSFTPEQVGKAIDAAGVSNIVELTDELTKLAPVRLKGMNERLHVGESNVDISKVADAINQAGGGAGLPNAIGRLQKLEQGADKPPCLADTVNGRRQVRVLAAAVGTATSISFAGETPELRALLGEIGMTFPQVQTLPLSRFRSVFNRVIDKRPACRYTIEFRETTRIVDARDAAGGIFYLRLRR
jgi:hypothetical protein